MSTNLNKHRLNNLIRGLQNSIAQFESQGYTEIYFTAQFFRGGKKQNGIERGDLTSFAKQIRTYVTSEDADGARIDFINEQTGKSIYSKSLTDLRTPAKPVTANQHQPQQQAGLGGYMGLGEAQVAKLIDQRVAEHRRQDEFVRMNAEIDELRSKNHHLEEKAQDLEAQMKAKSQIEFYSGIIGTAFPGLAGMLAGTPLAPAANFLAGVGCSETAPATESSAMSEEARSFCALVTEFCASLNARELAALHLLFVAFEKDPNNIQKAFQIVTLGDTMRAAA
jgi:hypothetical protein